MDTPICSMMVITFRSHQAATRPPRLEASDFDPWSTWHGEDEDSSSGGLDLRQSKRSKLC